MKVTVTPSGDVQLEVTDGDGAAAVELIHQLQADAAQRRTDDEKQSHSVALASLTAKQRKLYDVLCDFDQPQGCHVSGLAALLETTQGAVSHMLNVVLVPRHLARRVTRGHYRAIQEENE